MDKFTREDFDIITKSSDNELFRVTYLRLIVRGQHENGESEEVIQKIKDDFAGYSEEAIIAIRNFVQFLWKDEEYEDKTFAQE